MAERLLIVSDVHYAGADERRRVGFEGQSISRPLVRALIHVYRRFFWRKDPFAYNHLVEAVIEACPSPDWVIANGDYSCDSAFVGVADDAAFASARECLAKFRKAYGSRFRATIGDHELGKTSLAGGVGGLRWASWVRSLEGLGLEPFWEFALGRYRIVGITSSLVALPVLEAEAVATEVRAWNEARKDHLRRIAALFESLASRERVLLFCHDPTALPFLFREERIQRRLGQVERTIIGHLHSELILWKSRLLAGMPMLPFGTPSLRRMNAALSEARCWPEFKVLLCPSLGGIELLKDGGYYSAWVDPAGAEPVQFERHSLRRALRKGGSVGN